MSADPFTIGRRDSLVFDLARTILDTRWLVVLFVICALPTGILLALRTPMGQVADEPAHIARAAGLSTGQIFGQRTIFTNPGSHHPFAVSGVMVNIGIVASSVSETPPGPARALTQKRLRAAQAIKWAHGTMFDVAPNTVQYFPFFYLPATIGLGAGRFAGLSPLDSLFAGRLMMVLSYVALGTLALYVSTWGRGVLFTLLMMPMAISLGASYNQDGQLFASTALAAALLTHDPAKSNRARRLGIVLLVLLICSKPPYGLLLFVGLVPLALPNLIGRALRLSLFAIPPIVWVAIMAAVSMVTFHSAAYHPGPLWTGSKSILFHGTSPPDNLAILLAKPSRFISMPVALLLMQWHNFAMSAVGVLGWLSIPLPSWQYDGWYVATAIAVIGVMSARSPWGIAPADSVLVLVLVILTVFAIAIAQYLSWTSVGAAAIDGVTGRYFLLFLPFIMLGLPRLGHKIDAGTGVAGTAGMMEGISAIPAVIMAGYDVYGLPSLVSRIFHT